MFKQPKSMMEKFRQMSAEDRANMAREIHDELREQYKKLVPTIGMNLEPLFEEAIPVATNGLDASAHVDIEPFTEDKAVYEYVATGDDELSENVVQLDISSTEDKDVLASVVSGSSGAA